MAFYSLFREMSAYIPAWSTIAYCTVAVYHTVPEIWGVHIHKRKLELRRHGLQVQVPKETLNFCQQVFDDIMLAPKHEANVTFFHTNRPWIVSRGAVMHLFGGVIGLPETFNDIDHQNCMPLAVSQDSRLLSDGENPSTTTVTVANDKATDKFYDDKGGKYTNKSNPDKSSTGCTDTQFNQMNDSKIDSENSVAIFMSDDAKRFALARDIYGLTTYHVLVENCIGFALYMGAYFSGSSIRQLSGFKKWARMSIYSMLGMVAVSSYFVFSGKYHQHRQFMIDEKAVKLGESYATGAMEFYEKLEQFENVENTRNKSLRQRCRAMGQSLRTVTASDRLRHVKDSRTTVSDV